MDCHSLRLRRAGLDLLYSSDITLLLLLLLALVTEVVLVCSPVDQVIDGYILRLRAAVLELDIPLGSLCLLLLALVVCISKLGEAYNHSR